MAALTGLTVSCGAGPTRPGGGEPAEAADANLPIPPLAGSTVDPDGARRFALDLRADGRSSLLPGRLTGTWGVNGAHLGPTVRVARGERVRIEVGNRTGEPTNLHWHGMRLPARMDGGPHRTIEPGATWIPEWVVDQPAATLWYHPHPHGKTGLHLYRGLAGLLLVEDPDEPALPHDYGVDDIPLMIQDKRIHPDGSLDESQIGTGTYGLLGDVVLVNGVPTPLFEVAARQVRFRLLNASNARAYRVGFADGRPMRLVATDVGRLAAPMAVQRLGLTPGERAEIVVEFTPGERVTLTSDPAGDETDEIRLGSFDLLRIAAAATLADAAPVPARLGGTEPIGPPPGTRTRRFILGNLEINGRRMDPGRIDEVVPADAYEVWEVSNSRYSHNFHIHGVVFHVLTIDGAAPPAHLRGPKDTVFVPANSTLRLGVQFGPHVDPTGPFMYHCHILRHEDAGMMGQFVVVAPGTEDRQPGTLPGHDDHG
jgi:FtsP/CotA-like multicopper oxidase with cupredoxin domain